jgi:hypothetical protein
MFIGAAVDHIGVAIDYIFTRKCNAAEFARLCVKLMLVLFCLSSRIAELYIFDFALTSAPQK